MNYLTYYSRFWKIFCWCEKIRSRRNLLLVGYISPSIPLRRLFQVTNLDRIFIRWTVVIMDSQTLVHCSVFTIWSSFYVPKFCKAEKNLLHLQCYLYRLIDQVLKLVLNKLYCWNHTKQAEQLNGPYFHVFVLSVYLCKFMYLKESAPSITAFNDSNIFIIFFTSFTSFGGRRRWKGFKWRNTKTQIKGKHGIEEVCSQGTSETFADEKKYIIRLIEKNLGLSSSGQKWRGVEAVDPVDTGTVSDICIISFSIGWLLLHSLFRVV